MRFIEKTDCKLSVRKWQCQWPQHLQNKKHLSTFVRFFCRLFALQLNAFKFTIG